jgi:hypothetical protein
MMIVNDNSRVVNKLEASLTDDARVILYDRVKCLKYKPLVLCVYGTKGADI